MISRIFVINPSVLLQDLHHALIRFLISLLVCAVLCVITFTRHFISSHECADLSPSTCKLLFMFWHLIFCCPSSYCIPHAIIKCRMNILISYFPCLAARFFPREDCSIHPLALLFAYLRIEIALSARMSAPSFAGSAWCAFTSTNRCSKQPWRLLSLLQSFFIISRSLLPEYPRQVPLPT